MRVDLIDHMGSDLSVVNAARVSYGNQIDKMRDKDSRLLKYLADHNHWTPFAHPHLSFRIKANIAVARQLYRHQVGLTVNEVSRRYVSTSPEFDFPSEWRSRPNKGQSKQGSGELLDEYKQQRLNDIAAELAFDADIYYNTVLDMGVAPEQARLFLPMSSMTEWIWTGSLMAFIRICKERLAEDAQAETRNVAEGIYKYLCYLFPESMKAWGIYKD